MGLSNMPDWALKALVWGSTTMGAALLTVIVYVWGIMANRVDALESSARAQERRQDIWETRSSYQLEEISKSLDKIKTRLNIE